MICRKKRKAKRKLYREILAKRQREAKDKLIDFLAKTGNPAAAEQRLKIFGTFNPQDIQTMLDNFGKPNTLIMSPKIMEEFKKLFKGSLK